MIFSLNANNFNYLLKFVLGGRVRVRVLGGAVSGAGRSAESGAGVGAWTIAGAGLGAGARFRAAERV